MTETEAGAKTTVHQTSLFEHEIFRSTDALWEEYRGLTPYHYVANNPVRLKDPSGFGEDDGINWWEVTKGATAAVVNDYSFGLIDFTKSSDHPHFKQGVEAGHVGVIVVSQMGAESAKGTAAAGHVVTVASGGTAAEVSEPVAWVSTAGALYLSGVSIYATTQYMQSKATEVGGGDSKLPGAKGTKTQGSKSMWYDSQSKARLDVENIDPGKRPASLHYQDKTNKFMYNFETGKFDGMPNKLQKQLKENKEFQRALQNALKLLGEK